MKRLIIILSLLFIAYIGYRYYNRFLYYSTLECEELELAYCIDKLPIGININEFDSIGGNIVFSQWWVDSRNNKNFTLRAFDILKDCPSSGYMYCGIYFRFENNILKAILAGNPCH